MEPYMPYWIVVQHRANDGPRVKFAIRSLDCADYEVHFPRFIDRRPKRDDTIRPLYPGYMFVRIPAQSSWGPIVRVQNVVRVLCDSDGHAIPIHDAVIQEHITRAGGALEGVIDETPESVARFRQKSRLHVVSGALQGFEGICHMDDGKRIEVLMHLLGADRIVTVAREQVASAEPTDSPQNAASRS
ncbi:MAG: hypothetical protein NVSMB20_17410 [Bradyrhizobium sp.]